MTKVEFFRSDELSSIQKLINKFMDENPVEYVDAEFNKRESGIGQAEVMLVYRETISAEQEKGVERLDS